MDIQELVRAQRAYFDTGATRPYAFRLLQLKKRPSRTSTSVETSVATAWSI